MNKPGILLRLTATAALALSLAAGCATTRDAKWNADEGSPATAESGDQAEGLIAEGDALWAERLDQAKLEQAIGKWEEAAKAQPSNDLYVKLARGHYFLADTHHALAGNVEARDDHYTMGLDFAEKGLKLTAPEFVEAMKAGAKHRDAISKAPLEAVPAMYWYSTNMSKWASSKGFATILRYKDDIKATMVHVMALSPDFFYAAPDRYFGAYEARTAGIAGGSLEKSEKHFNDALAKEPAHLGTKVLWAEYLTVKQGAGGKEKCRSLLEEVIAADPTAVPELEPENRMEQEKAKQLLAKIDSMF
jgi:tetratricopeptide (TPR) repeat protein